MKIAASVFLLCLSVALPASAQVIGKVPPAAPATPEYTPPPPPAPPPPPKPAEPEKPLPSLVVKDASDKLKRYPEGTERAAINAFEFDAETRQKIAASSAARDADVEKMVIEKLDKVLEAKATKDRMEEIKDFGEFAKIKDVAAAVQAEKLSDRLTRDGAINAMQRGKIDQVIKQYEAALSSEWQAETGSNILKIASLVAKEKFNELTADAFAGLDRLLGRAATDLAGSAEALNLKPEQKPAFDAAAAALGQAAGPDAPAKRLEVIAGWFYKDLTLDQQRALLSRVGPQSAGK